MSRFNTSVTRGPSLVQRAADLLEAGSLHTLDLARQVLGLSGNAGAASARDVIGPRFFNYRRSGNIEMDPSPFKFFFNKIFH